MWSGSATLNWSSSTTSAKPFPPTRRSWARRTEEENAGPEPAGEDDSNVLATYEPTTITHRRGQTRFLESSEEGEEAASKVSRAAAKLCRLAFELGKAPDAVTLATIALSGLFEGAMVDAGALLLLPRDFQGTPTGADLEVVASQTTSDTGYHRVSTFLATTVMREGEAVLARNVMDDSTLSSRDSKGEILATSVICAPVRRGKRVLGLLHLYSTDPNRIPDPDDLEFTLAVAETVAVALTNLHRRQELAENLTQVRIENVQLREQLGVQSEIVGISDVVRKLTEEIARAANSRATVLIRGESGVGKELVARAVHYSSPRRKSVFVCLNCAHCRKTCWPASCLGTSERVHRGDRPQDRQVRSGPRRHPDAR